MKKIFLTYAWLLLTTGLLLVSGAVYNFYYLAKYGQSNSSQQLALSVPIQADHNVVAQGNVLGVESIVETQDGRPEIIANFLQKKGSPLKPYDYYGEALVKIADRYGIDFRLLPSIMMQESNLCKNIPEGTFNCLGFGIHERGTLGFENYEAGFDRAARELKQNYIDQGLTTVSLIMSKYCPHSDGSWANSVNQWMAEMEYNDRQMGLEKKKDADVMKYSQEAGS
ncbi:MAG: hypothetical protein GF381_03710 [Candidatus Pacebacteria bacterium]|nr:hypothetical protein [Candidatus Paceibacterota bacterium]